MTQKNKKRKFTITETADILGVSPQAVYNAIERDNLKARRKGNKRYITAEEIAKYAGRVGHNPEKIIKEMSERTGEKEADILKWVLIGAGLYIAWQMLTD